MSNNVESSTWASTAREETCDDIVDMWSVNEQRADEPCDVEGRVNIQTR